VRKHEARYQDIQIAFDYFYQSFVGIKPPAFLARHDSWRCESAPFWNYGLDFGG